MAGGGELGEEVVKKTSLGSEDSVPEISLDAHGVSRFVTADFVTAASSPGNSRPQAWRLSEDVEPPEPAGAQLPNQVPGSVQSSEDVYAVHRQGSFSSARETPAAPGLHADVWEVVEGEWQVTHQFERCLEMDCMLSGCTQKTRAHLPVASLRALEHLHTLLRTPESVSLDLVVDDSAGYGKVSSLLLNRASASLSPVDLVEAGAMLQKRSQVARRHGPSSANPEPAVNMEAADIAVCTLQGCNEAQAPLLSLGRLARPLLLENPAQAPPVRFVGLVLCGVQRMQLATQLACAVAVAIMDDDFATALRSAPSSNQQGVLEAFESYLSTLTILPTVNTSAAGLGGAMPPMMDSLVDQLQNTLFRPARGLDTLADAQGDHQPAQPEAEAEESTSPKGRQHFLVEVHEMTGGAVRWSTTHRFQCGLEVDVAKKSERPHLPRVNVVALAKARKLMTPTSVALDAAAEDAVLDRLMHGGLPQAAHAEVVAAMAVPGEDAGACGTQPQSDLGSRACRALIKPVGKEEACHVLAITCKQLPHAHGIVGAFVRFRSHVSLGVSPKSPTRFVLCFVGPESTAGELSTMVDSLAALVVDEELMTDLIAAGDVPGFLGSLDARLDRLLVVPHTRLQAALKKTQSRSTSVTSSASVTSVDSSSHSPVRDEGPQQPKRSRRTVLSVFRYAVRKARKYSLPLVLGVLLALVWSNADLESYHEFVETPIFGLEFKTGNKVHLLSLHFLVNDIFMCFFFGLAIKEVAEALLPGGSLNPVRRAVNPLVATVGGVAGPALAYTLIVSLLYVTGVFDGTLCATGAETSSASHRRLAGATADGMEMCSLGTILRGWGVTVATDISLAWMFALLIFGAGHPAINFLLLLAIVDDALGVVIIAVCYPDPANPVVPWWLLLVLAAMLMAFGLRMLKVSFWTPYIFLCGPVSWFGLLSAHVHPALALVFVVPFMPAHTSVRRGGFGSTRWGTRMWQTNNSLVLQRAREILEQHHADEAPLHMFELSLKLPVDFGMFFFGLANAGVSLNEAGALTVSVLAALVVGKTLGIAAAGLLATRMGFALPHGVTVLDLFVISALGGTGLTVALFVANEAFVDPGLQGQAKFAAVLSVSSVCLACALRWISRACGPPVPESPQSGLSAQKQSPFDIVLPEGAAEAGVAGEGGYLDDMLVDELMQIMYLQRRYRARQSTLPFLEQQATPLNTPGSQSPSGGASLTPGFIGTFSDPMTMWRISSKRSTASRHSHIQKA